MKKIWLVLIVLLLMFTIAGCGGGKNNEPDPDDDDKLPSYEITIVKSGDGTVKYKVGSAAEETLTDDSVVVNAKEGALITITAVAGGGIIEITDTGNENANFTENVYLFSVGAAGRTITVTFALASFYEITIPTGLTNATVATNAVDNEAAAGSAVKVSLTITDGYFLKTGVKVTTGDEDEDVIALGGREFSFIMPSADVEIVLTDDDLEEFDTSYTIIKDFNTPKPFALKEGAEVKSTGGVMFYGSSGGNHKYWPEFCEEFSVSGDYSLRLNYRTSNSGFRWGVDADPGESVLIDMEGKTHIVFYMRVTHAGPGGGFVPRINQDDSADEIRASGITNPEINVWKKYEIPIDSFKDSDGVVFAGTKVGAFYIYTTAYTSASSSITFDAVTHPYGPAPANIGTLTDEQIFSEYGISRDGSSEWEPKYFGETGQAIWIDALGVR